MKVEDPLTNDSLRISPDNRALIAGITSSVFDRASLRGEAYLVSTGPIALTSNSDNAVLYIKNIEPADSSGESRLLIQTLFVGIGDANGATLTEEAVIRVLRNPTAGTIVSGASAATVANANFGSSKTFASTTLAYKGASGNTFTDGTVYTRIVSSISTTLGAGVQNTAQLSVTLPRNASFGVTIDPNTTGSTNVYVSVTLYKVDGSLLTSTPA